MKTYSAMTALVMYWNLVFVSSASKTSKGGIMEGRGGVGTALPFSFSRPVLIGESRPASVTGANHSHFWFPEMGGVIGGHPSTRQQVSGNYFIIHGNIKFTIVNI